MNTPQKTNALQSYQILLYDRALHPELFALKGRRVVRGGPWELEAWVMQGQHVLRFERGSVCAAELVTDQEAGLPTTGALAAALCAGERDYEHTFTSRNAVVAGANGHGSPAGGKGSVVYISTVQTESLSENLYIATCDEMAAHVAENGSLVHTWEDESGKGMSIIDLQRYASEVHAQAYHLIPSGGVVIRTQAIFELG